ncbi:hypothetical protein QYM36_020068 [Artemia franciscana]|uniref:mRNA-decapping enzyme 2 n=1 Tax=Artemia franciscana TaxID=6661 RepID=A0AA88H4G6_ARTSF|nr:hypothetical protein QYM36_020068 [Artemia franciscana]
MNINIPEALSKEIQNLFSDKIFLQDSEEAIFQNSCHVFSLLEKYYYRYVEGDTKYENSYKKVCSVSFRSFAKHCFKRFSNPSEFTKVYGVWHKYRRKTPTYGCVLLDESLEEVVVVRGPTAGDFLSQWTFPKGKIEKNEGPVDCAIREVIEEIGFDCKSVINPQYFIERKCGLRNQRLFLVPGISKTYQFKTNSPNEIQYIAWVRIEDVRSDDDPRSRFIHLKKMLDKLHQFRIENEEIWNSWKKPFKLSTSSHDCLKIPVFETPICPCHVCCADKENIKVVLDEHKDGRFQGVKAEKKEKEPYRMNRRVLPFHSLGSRKPRVISSCNESGTPWEHTPIALHTIHAIT